MATLEIKDSKGKVVGKHEQSAAIAAIQPVAHLLHNAVVAEEANSRQGTQKTKTRAEVRGGGRKPYKQKKTGNARQGSIRAPHYAHGGMALAIAPRDYDKKLNRKERRAALVGAMNAQIEAGNVVVADKLVFTAAKTKDALNFLKGLGVAESRRVLVIFPAYDEVAYKCFRNLPNVTVRTAPSNESGTKTVAFSTRDLLVAHKIVIAADALKAVEATWGSDEVKAKPAREARAKDAKDAKGSADAPARATKEAKPKAEPKAKAAPKAEAKAPAKKAPAKKKTDGGDK